MAKKFAKLVEIDPWMINPYFAQVRRASISRSAPARSASPTTSTACWRRSRKKYSEYGIKEKPFVIIKADAGTYGMGVMTVHDASEVARRCNRKQRNKMEVVKDGLEVHDVIVQEGVHTFERINDAVAEPVVYMIDRYVVGGFYRVHAARGVDREPERAGHAFRAARFRAARRCPTRTPSPARRRRTVSTCTAWWRGSALLAASIELEKTDPDPEVY